MSESSALPAGAFSRWLRHMRAALGGDGAAHVPCGECSACCSTSHFVHVGPEETLTLARIPRALLVHAPGLPAGTKVLGYDGQGRCPMLAADGRCSIYEERPLTCRMYDCRVFAAAGIAADREPIARQARRWRFSYPSEDDRDRHAAVQAAARFLRERAECFPEDSAPRDPVLVALLAVKTCDVFFETGGEPGEPACTAPDSAIARAVIQANERFEAARSEARRSPDEGRPGAAAGRDEPQVQPDS